MRRSQIWFLNHQKNLNNSKTRVRKKIVQQVIKQNPVNILLHRKIISFNNHEMRLDYMYFFNLNQFPSNNTKGYAGLPDEINPD